MHHPYHTPLTHIAPHTHSLTPLSLSLSLTHTHQTHTRTPTHIHKTQSHTHTHTPTTHLVVPGGHGRPAHGVAVRPAAGARRQVKLQREKKGKAGKMGRTERTGQTGQGGGGGVGVPGCEARTPLSSVSRQAKYLSALVLVAVHIHDVLHCQRLVNLHKTQTARCVR